MSWKLFDPTTPILIQGITGKEGARMARWLVASGANVVGGVTPGKGGQLVEGKPVFDSVAALREKFPVAAVSSIVVPAPRVLGAVEEAVAAGVTHIHLLTENVPVHDVRRMREIVAAAGATLLGPSSIGYLQFPRFRVGYLGGESPFESVKEGGVAVISTSGGMTNELMMSLAREGIGIRTALATGGDRIVGFSLEDAIQWNESLPEVTSLALFVEPGRALLRNIASGEFTFSKPVAIFLAGASLDLLPRGMPYGHTGTILGEDDPSVAELRGKIVARGVPCVDTMADFLSTMKTYG